MLLKHDLNDQIFQQKHQFKTSPGQAKGVGWGTWVGYQEKAW